MLLEVENVSKKFCSNLHRSMMYAWGDIASNILNTKATPALRESEFFAVRNFSLKMEQGQILCLLGNNGCGKTTLMRMIYGIYPPDEGSIKVHGTMAAMFALRTGMQPYFTGRENIYLKGSILGFSEDELKQKTEEIIAFSELGDAIDKPFGSYSSGMMSRLAYSLPVAMKPDVLIIDEGLAVGDIGFKNKCLDDLKKKQNERTVIFITHNFERIKELATDIVIMNQGEKKLETKDVKLGLEIYLTDYANKAL